MGGIMRAIWVSHQARHVRHIGTTGKSRAEDKTLSIKII